MTLRTRTALLLSIPLSLGLVLSGCSDDGPSIGDSDSDSGTASDSGDSGESGNEMSGDGDPTTGDGDPNCPIGAEGCPCTGGGICDPGLMCEDGTCVPATGDGDGDPGTGDGDPTGDGDGDPTGDGDGDPTGDGDGDPTGDGDGDPSCMNDEIIEIAAVDATDIVGWDPAMSQLGEGMILIYDDMTPNAYVSWDVDIPCDADWHVWVRGFDQGAADSYFVQVDGGPNPVPIFELDCSGQGNGYVWTELNWRDQNDGPCMYVQDPWIQTWAAGVHNVTLGYRPGESIALSRIWITNTNMNPP